MRAEELRIGNYIYNPVQKINFKVNLVTLSNIISDNLKRSTKNEEYHYKPIPLTEEILLKCGAQKTRLAFASRFVINDFVIFETFNMNKESEGFHIRTDKEIEVDYLHELQNHYYWNNNKKELKVKI